MKRAGSGSRRSNTHNNRDNKHGKPGYRAAAGIKGGYENGKGGRPNKKQDGVSSSQSAVKEPTDREVSTSGGAKIVTYTNVSISGTVSQRGMSFADMLKAKGSAPTIAANPSKPVAAAKPIKEEPLQWAEMSEPEDEEPMVVKNSSRISTPVFEPAAPRDVHVEPLEEAVPAEMAWAAVVGGKKKEKEEKVEKREEKKEERGRSARGASPTRTRSRSARHRSPSAARAAAVYEEQDDKVVLPFDMQVPKKDIFSFSGSGITSESSSPTPPIVIEKEKSVESPTPSTSVKDSAPSSPTSKPTAAATSTPPPPVKNEKEETSPTPTPVKKEKKKKQKPEPQQPKQKEEKKEDKKETKKRKTKAEKKAEKRAAEQKAKEEEEEEKKEEATTTANTNTAVAAAAPQQEKTTSKTEQPTEEGKISKAAVDTPPSVPNPYNRANWGLGLGEIGASTNHLGGGMMGQGTTGQQPPPQHQQQKPKQEGGKGGKGREAKKVFNRSGWGTNTMEGHPMQSGVPPTWGMDYRQQFGTNAGTALGSVISSPTPNNAPQGQPVGAAGKGGKKSAPTPTPTPVAQLPTVTGQQLPWSTWAGSAKPVEGKQLPGNFPPNYNNYYSQWNNGVPGMNGWAQQQQMYLYYQQQQMAGGMGHAGYGAQPTPGLTRKQSGSAKKQTTPKPPQGSASAATTAPAPVEGSSGDQPRGNWGSALSREANVKKQGGKRKGGQQKPKN